MEGLNLIQNEEDGGQRPSPHKHKGSRLRGHQKLWASASSRGAYSEVCCAACVTIIPGPVDASHRYRVQENNREETPGGLVECVIVLGNDQIKSADLDYAEALSAHLEPLVSEKYRVTINERLYDAIDGYLDGCCEEEHVEAGQGTRVVLRSGGDCAFAA